MYHGYTLFKIDIIFLQSLLHYQNIFTLLREMLYAGHVKLFDEASELFTQAVFQLVVGR
jgi:hypothetical protein